MNCKRITIDDLHKAASDLNELLHLPRPHKKREGSFFVSNRDGTFFISRGFYQNSWGKHIKCLELRRWEGEHCTTCVLFAANNGELYRLINAFIDGINFQFRRFGNDQKIQPQSI